MLFVENDDSSGQNQEKLPSSERDVARSHSEALKKSFENELKMKLADQAQEFQDKIKQTELECCDKLSEQSKEHLVKISGIDSELANTKITCLRQIGLQEHVDRIKTLESKHQNESAKQAEDSSEKNERTRQGS